MSSTSSVTRSRTGLAAIVSASKDGGVVARVLEHFGVQPVRGSSSRRGAQALLELTTWIDAGMMWPLPPMVRAARCYVVQNGPDCLGASHRPARHPCCLQFQVENPLKSWDRFQIPLPFARIHATFGEPLHIPRNISEEEKEALRLELQNRILRLTAD